MNKNKKIIVIGSGFGGIASALRMRAKGYQVTLLEKHPDVFLTRLPDNLSLAFVTPMQYLQNQIQLQ